jgi:hypothetical protein
MRVTGMVSGRLDSRDGVDDHRMLNKVCRFVSS